MTRNRTYLTGSHKVAWLLLLCAVGLAGCAGSSPDFSDRTRQATAKQNQLAAWLSEDVKDNSASSILAPVCSSTVGHPEQGWAIDGGNWCVIACPILPDNNVLNRWMKTSEGLRCFATDKSATALVSTEFEQTQLSLDQQLLFRGFDRSFVSDTEWNCIEQEYRIDPGSRRGFWVDLGTGNTYRFYKDGALMIARAGAPMKFAGDWRGRASGDQGSNVLVNDRDVFRYAVNYGGGRFDEFRSATRKQLCRFKDHPGPRI